MMPVLLLDELWGASADEVLLVPVVLEGEYPGFDKVALPGTSVLG